jgi:hypothetical protein
MIMSQPGAKNWIDLGDWGKGMDGFKLPSVDELAGKELRLHFSAGSLIVYKFHDATSLTWEVCRSSNKGRPESETYEAIRVAPNIYFVDFVRKNQPGVSTSVALDLNSGMATVVNATLPDKNEIGRGFADRLGKGIDLSMVKVEILHASVNPLSPDDAAAPHERTEELIGKRIKYMYSKNHVYEHIYLNHSLYTWHCLKGVEKGLADTEICDYFKIAPEVYLFIWREKVMPTFGAVLINLKEMRSNGKTFGLDIGSGKYVNFSMGAVIESIVQAN